MPDLRRVPLTVAVATAMLLGMSPGLAFAQAADLEAGWGRDVIDPIADEAERSVVISAWIDTHGWQGLTPAQKVLALDNLNVGGTSADAFSARWQGVLAAPQSGVYTFTRRGVPACADDWMRVWVDGELVLDTSDAEFVPTPVELTTSAVAIRVDLSRDASGDCWPISSALLGWQMGAGEVETVPTSAFRTEADGEDGLSAQYFSDPAFETLFAERVDASVDLVWDDDGAVTVANSHLETRRALAASVLDIAFIESIFETDADRYTESGGQHAGGYLGYAARNMSGSQREQLALMLLSRPDLLGQVDGYSLKELMWHILPVSDQLHADLLVVWAGQQPRYTTTIGAYPGWEHNGYYNRNWDPLAHAGRALSGHLDGVTMSPESIDYLLDEVGIARADGTANLHLIPLLCYACKESAHRPRSDVGVLIETQLGRDDVEGDTRATWLAARALFEENDTADTPRLGKGWSSLERALVVAESVSVRFWVLNEMVARAISLGEEELALSLISSLEHQFLVPTDIAPGTSMTYVEVFESWRTQASDHGERRRLTAAREELDQRVANIRAEIARIELRIQALGNGEDDSARRANAAAQLQDAQSRLAIIEAEQAALDD